MAQKYKVFINDTAIELVSRKDVANTFYTTVDFSKLDQLIDQMLDHSGQDTTVLCDDVDVAWSVFRSRFKWVDAAGGLVVNPAQEVLMIFRNERWDLPKGKVEQEERIDHAAVREVEEECCVMDLELGALVGRTYHVYPLKKKIALKCTTWYHMKSQGRQLLAPQLEEGITRVEWVSKPVAAERLAGSFRSLSDFFTPHLQ